MPFPQPQSKTRIRIKSIPHPLLHPLLHPLPPNKPPLLFPQQQNKRIRIKKLSPKPPQPQELLQELPPQFVAAKSLMLKPPNILVYSL